MRFRLIDRPGALIGGVEWIEARDWLAVVAGRLAVHFDRIASRVIVLKVRVAIGTVERSDKLLDDLFDHAARGGSAAGNDRHLGRESD
jgi:hypothetical protein